ncbi:MAG: glycosyltransferase [Bacteroidetes bacterium]|nr:glycosyltransferase [Bacteroidota bacterium]MBS1541606.1 glycosyltransferase [Bacteroidota bacterium]
MTESNKLQFISVVVAVRNEQHNIKRLASGLLQQRYDRRYFEIILVDDHSADKTIESAGHLLKDFSNLTFLILSSKVSGKKAALSAGIAAAQGTIIATTDADCLLPVDWLQQINFTFTNERCRMAIGPVSLQATGFFSQMQAQEFAGVMAVTFGTLGWRKPLLCNGANLAYRKQAFVEVNGYEGNEHIASGDDEFLMRKIQERYPDSIHLLNTLVRTQPSPTVKDFFRQRIRWAGKWKANSSWPARLLALFIFAVQVSWIVFLFCYPAISIYLFGSGIVVKLFLDAWYLNTVAARLQVAMSIFPFLVLQFFYPFYVVGVGILSLWKKAEWKGRTV